MATAVIPVCPHWLNKSLSRAAPSSMEYSVCTWRCTNEPSPADPAAVTGNLLRGRRQPGAGLPGPGEVAGGAPAGGLIRAGIPQEDGRASPALRAYRPPPPTATRRAGARHVAVSSAVRLLPPMGAEIRT